jgi:hypothetical protein
MRPSLLTSAFSFADVTSEEAGNLSQVYILCPLLPRICRKQIRKNNQHNKISVEIPVDPGSNVGAKTCFIGVLLLSGVR